MRRPDEFAHRGLSVYIMRDGPSTNPTLQSQLHAGNNCKQICLEDA